eukprot:sb/3461257/
MIDMDIPEVSKLEEEVTDAQNDDESRLNRVSHELFNKMADYMQTELSGTKDTYAMLEELNGIALEQYSKLTHSTSQIKDSLNDLDVKYKLLLPYLEQLNQLDVSVASLEQATLRLDAYTKVLESKNMSKVNEEATEPLNKRPRLTDSPFYCIPDEVLLFILRYLDSPDLFNCRSVSRTWRELSNVLLLSRQARTASYDEKQADSEPRFAEFTTERVVEGEVSLHQLPGEVILHIFTFLEPVELINCGKVCKLWFNLSTDALRSVQSIKFEPYVQPRPISYDNSCRTITCSDKDIVAALNTFRGIVHDVQCAVSMGNLAALNTLPNLKSLFLGCTTISIAFAHAVAVYLPRSLESLDINNLRNYDAGDRICQILSKQPFLQKLGLGDTDFYSVEKFASILEKLQLRKLSLNLFGIKNQDRFPVKINKIFASVAETLEQLSVRGSFLVDPKIPLPYFKHLKNLTFRGCDMLDEKSLESLLSRMPKLRQLSFRECQNITGKSVVKTLKGLPIESITFERGLHSKLENDTILQILVAFSDTLEQLKLPCEFLKFNRFHQLSVFPKLTFLRLSSVCRRYFDSSRRNADLSSQLLSLLVRMPNLQRVNFRDFAFSMKICIPDIMLMCPKIHYFDVSEICGVARDNNPDLYAFRQMSRVRNLKIFYANGTNIAYLSFCKSLTSLTLFHFSISDTELAFIISHLKKLKYLELDYCQNLTGGFLELLTVEERSMDFEILSLLLKAKSKDVVHKICSECISDHHSDAIITTISDILSCSRSDSRALLTSLGHMARRIVSTNLSTTEDISGVFPESFHKSLKGLLTKISVELVPFWREIMAENSERVTISLQEGYITVEQELHTTRLLKLIDAITRICVEISGKIPDTFQLQIHLLRGNKIDPVESYLPGPVHLGVVGMFKGRRVKISEVQLWEDLPDIQSALLKLSGAADPISSDSKLTVKWGMAPPYCLRVSIDKESVCHCNEHNWPDPIYSHFSRSRAHENCGQSLMDKAKISVLAKSGWPLNRGQISLISYISGEIYPVTKSVVLATKSGWPLNRGQISLISYISGEIYPVTKSVRQFAICGHRTIELCCTPGFSITLGLTTRLICPFLIGNSSKKILSLIRGATKSGVTNSGSDCTTVEPRFTGMLGGKDELLNGVINDDQLTAHFRSRRLQVILPRRISSFYCNVLLTH